MINKRFLGKGGIVDYQTSNTAYDKLAFIADNYPDMVKMYDTIMAHLKLPSNEGGSGCNYLKHTYSGFPVVIKVGNVTMYGYDTSKPDDMEIIRNSLSINYDGFQTTKPMYAEEFKYTVKQLATPRGKYLLNLFTEKEYLSFLNKYDDDAVYGFYMYVYGFATQVSRIENGVAYDTENNPIDSIYRAGINISLGNINLVASSLGGELPDTVKCLVLAKTDISSINNDYIVGYSDTLYSDYSSTPYSSSETAYKEETVYKEVTLNNVFIFPCHYYNMKYAGRYPSHIQLFSKDRTDVGEVYGYGNFHLISAVPSGNNRSFLSCGNLLSYKNGLVYTVQSDIGRCDITDNYCTDVVMEYS